MAWYMIRKLIGKRAQDADPSLTTALLRPLSPWFVLLAVVVVAAVAWPLTQWLYTIAGDDPGRKIDAVRTGLSVAAGTGGVFALLLAFRRQRSTEVIAEQTRVASERDHGQRERQSKQVEFDALNRRITDQYTAAAEQLGSDKAPVRLAGLYALERIGDANAVERQTVISLICAYLRMPYEPLIGRTEDGTATITGNAQYLAEELEVRLAAQEILWHRTRGSRNHETVSAAYWVGMNINLTRATLINFTLAGCDVNQLILQECEFQGPIFMGPIDTYDTAKVQDSTFYGDVVIGEADFRDLARLSGCEFKGSLNLDRVCFHRSLSFGNNTVAGQFNVCVAAPSHSIKELGSESWPQDCSLSILSNGRLLLANRMEEKGARVEASLHWIAHMAELP